MLRLVLLPGLNGSSTLFAPLLAHLDSTLAVQTLCLPSQGSQDHEYLADTLLAKLGDTAFVLLGESFSGPLAYRLALRKPPGLRGVIFAASFLSKPHPLLPLTRYLPLPRWLLTQNSLLRLFCVNGHASAALLQALREELQTLPHSLLRTRLQSLNQLQSPRLQLELPTLHLMPKQDRLVTRQAQTNLRNYCKQLTEVTLDGPHFLLQTQPAACARAIHDFIHHLVQEQTAPKAGIAH